MERRFNDQLRAHNDANDAHHNRFHNERNAIAVIITAGDARLERELNRIERESKQRDNEQVERIEVNEMWRQRLIGALSLLSVIVGGGVIGVAYEIFK